MESDARECVTEEIISKIGLLLPLRIARSKLVRLEKNDIRFLSRNFVTRGEYELLHGIELFARYFDTNEKEVESAFGLDDPKKEKAFYTVNNILTVLETLFPASFPSISDHFFRMLAFDAFVGAPDRHAMNWGVLAPLQSGSDGVRYAPIYDTARGLFREISDLDLQRKICRRGREQFIEKYANNSYPIIGTGCGGKENHFSLVRWIAAHHRYGGLLSIRAVLDGVDVRRIERMLQMRFRRIVTQLRIGLIRDLLMYRLTRLREEVQS